MGCQSSKVDVATPTVERPTDVVAGEDVKVVEVAALEVRSTAHFPKNY